MPPHPTAHPDPRAVYIDGRDEELRHRARLSRQLRAIIATRIASLLLVAVAAYEGCTHGGSSAVLAYASAGLFVALTVAIFFFEAAQAKQDARIRYFSDGLSRLDEKTPQDAPDGAPYASPTHPYALDLDLFGKASLFERVCAARTGMGQARLAEWLKTPTPVAPLRERQEAVQELKENLRLRKELWIAGGLIRGNVHEDALAGWLQEPAQVPRFRDRVLVLALGSLGLGILYAFAFPQFLGVAAAIFLVQRIVAGRFRDRIRTVSAHGAERAYELRVMAAMAERLAAERFTSPHLTRLRATVAAPGALDHAAISALIRRIDWLESRRNPVFGLFATILLVPELLCFSIESWRARHGEAAKAWLSTLAETEALASLATFAFEHPTYVFPTVEEGAPMFEADGLGHPLIPSAARVCNPVALGPDCRLLVVTGSNMSGKSTLLRTVGINAVLALAGAPVCASRLRMSPLRVGASLRTQDSLDAGISRFFAEIQRLRSIVELAKAGPGVLFLLDEILSGTNSQDRHDGAAAVLRQLLTQGAIGLLTTHDLALSTFGEAGTFQGRNVHFEDRLEGEKLVFDYRMRDGVATRRNAMDLLRLVGIETQEARTVD